MVSGYKVSLEKIIKEFDLKVVTCEEEVKNIKIVSSDVNRAGLQLTGYNKHSDPERIQIIGNTETHYLEDIVENSQKKIVAERYFQAGFPCVIVTRHLPICQELIEASKKARIPILLTSDHSSRFISILVAFLSIELAPRKSVHGVLIEVYGEGCLILGESGVGKSETAMELVKRGHRLVADDVVEVRKVSEKSLVGTSPDQIRHFLEIRGVGIVDVKNLWGMGAVKMTEKINLIIHLENWVAGKEYERLGMNIKYEELLGIKVPSLLIPVKPGRNLAVILEVAAMNNRQLKMGYNAAETLNERLMESLQFEKDDESMTSNAAFK